MSREFAVKILEEKNEVAIKCNGRSMIPLIHPKETIHLKKVLISQLRVGDAVFVRIKRALQVHILSAIDNDRMQISNRKGFINGWVGKNSIYGLAVRIEDRVLVSNEELERRLDNE